MNQCSLQYRDRSLQLAMAVVTASRVAVGDYDNDNVSDCGDSDADETGQQQQWQRMRDTIEYQTRIHVYARTIGGPSAAFVAMEADRVRSHFSSDEGRVNGSDDDLDSTSSSPSVSHPASGDSGEASDESEFDVEDDLPSSQKSTSEPTAEIETLVSDSNSDFDDTVNEVEPCMNYGSSAATLDLDPFEHGSDSDDPVVAPAVSHSDGSESGGNCPLKRKCIG